MKVHEGSIFGFFHQEEPERKTGSPTNSLLSISHEIFDFKEHGYTAEINVNYFK